MNAEMIVKALKHCAKHNCEGCPYNGPSNFTGDCIDREEVLLIAADLIESLQVEVNEWQERHRQAAINWQQENKECVKLQEQLVESQRREKAAVEEIKAHRWVHVKSCANYEGCYKEAYDNCQIMPCATKRCKGFIWRGPQEGEGNAETDNPD